MRALLMLATRRADGGLWGWTYEGDDRPHAIVSYEANLTEPDYPWLRLRYDVNGERVDCMVRLRWPTSSVTRSGKPMRHQQQAA
jgi:hypothetical protein